MFFFSLFLILGSGEAWWKGGLSMGFFSLSLIMGGATMGEHGCILFLKIDHWLVGGKVEIHLENHMCHKL